MKQALNRISNATSAFISLILKLAQKQADHKKLTRHLLELNKKQSSIEIINEVALCLKDIINYRLFAFVIRKETTVDIWLDPRMYKNSLENIILKDFILEKNEQLNYINHAFQSDEPKENFDMNDLIFYDISQENCTFRIYMLPNKKPYAYQDEVVSLILQGCSFALSQQLKIESLTDAAIIDPLTRCYNRREFDNQLKRTVADAVRHKNDLSVFIFDLDHFKKINDTYGHMAGDKVLQEATRLVQNGMRTGDILARYGGEEFIAILPNTNKFKAMELADRLREKISRMTVVHNGSTIRVTASFGVSELNPKAGTDKIIQDADTMLYRAKNSGRNTVMPGVIKIICDDTSLRRSQNLI